MATITEDSSSVIIGRNYYAPTATSQTVDASIGHRTLKGYLDLANEDSVIEEIMRRLTFVPTFEHKCNSCGGVLEIKADEHIFRCPYCNTCYAIGTNMKNDRG